MNSYALLCSITLCANCTTKPLHPPIDIICPVPHMNLNDPNGTVTILRDLINQKAPL